MSSPEPRLKPDREIQLGDASGVAQPARLEFKQGPNIANPSPAESLLAAEKRTLEMMANGASLSEVLNDLCASIDAHAPPVTSMVCLMNPDGKELVPGAGPHIPAALTAAITPCFFSRRRRHTSSLRDWSSDVCSSDLAAGARLARHPRGARTQRLSVNDRARRDHGARSGAVGNIGDVRAGGEFEQLQVETA